MENRKLFEHTAPHLVTPAAPEEAGTPLIEPSLFYAPPYERPLEDEFAWHLVKYLQPISGLLYQVKTETPCGPVWVDFVVEHGARRIGFEISDAEAPVDDDEERFRDALVLGAGGLDVLYRLRGADLMYRLHDCLHLASQWEADLFSARGRINLQTLASREARACRPLPHEAGARVAYPADASRDGLGQDGEGDLFVWPEAVKVPAELVVRRLSRAHPSAWIRDYDRALTHFGVSDDRLGEQWAKSA